MGDKTVSALLDCHSLQFSTGKIRKLKNVLGNTGVMFYI